MCACGRSAHLASVERTSILTPVYPLFAGSLVIGTLEASSKRIATLLGSGDQDALTRAAAATHAHRDAEENDAHDNVDACDDTPCRLCRHVVCVCCVEEPTRRYNVGLRDP